MPDPNEILNTAGNDPLSAESVLKNASQSGVDPRLMSDEAAANFQANYERFQKTGAIGELVAGNPDGALRLSDRMYATTVNNDLKNLANLRAEMEKTRLPESWNAGENAFLSLKRSVVSAGYGAAAVATLPVTLVQLLFTDDTTIGGDIAEAATKKAEQFAKEGSEISERREKLGGSKVGEIVASVGGQAPEMLVTGFGTSILAKSLVGAGVKALTAASAGQGVISASQFLGSQALEERMTDGDFTLKDAAWAVGVGAFTGIVERYGGFIGEMRLAGVNRGKLPLTSTMLDVVASSGSEGAQEVFETFASDMAGEKEMSSLNEYAWSGFAGMIGGTMFSAPAIIDGLRRSASDAVAERAIETVKALNQLNASMAGASNTAENVGKVIEVARSIASMESLSAAKKAALVKKTVDAVSDSVFFERQDLDALASKLGITTDALVENWMISENGSQIEASFVDMALDLVKRDASTIRDIQNIVKKAPDTLSLSSAIEALKTHEKKIKGVDDKYELPDGTEDDSDELEKIVYSQVSSASVTSPARTDNMAVLEARLTSSVYRNWAIAWNQHSKTKMTPKQFYEKHGANFTRKSKVGGKKAALDQPARGEYTPSETGRPTITLSPGADASTVHHELMHHFLEVTNKLASEPNAPQFFKDQMRDVALWVGANKNTVIAKATELGVNVSIDDLNLALTDIESGKLDWRNDTGRAIHEALAKQFELYIHSGKAPSKRLESLFASMMNFIRAAYRRLGISDGDVNPEARRFFDNMIAAFDKVDPIDKVKLTAKDVGLTESTFSAVVGSIDKLVVGSVIKIRKKIEARQEAKLRKAAKLDKEALDAAIEDYLAADPHYQALLMVEGGIKLNRKMFESFVESNKINHAVSDEYLDDEGMNPEGFAQSAGYDPNMEFGDKALRDLIAALSSRMSKAEIEAGYRVIATDDLTGMSESNEAKAVIEVAAEEEALTELAWVQALSNISKMTKGDRAEIDSLEAKLAKGETITETDRTKLEELRQKKRDAAKILRSKLDFDLDAIRVRVKAQLQDTPLWRISPRKAEQMVGRLRNRIAEVVAMQDVTKIAVARYDLAAGLIYASEVRKLKHTGIAGAKNALKISTKQRAKLLAGGRPAIMVLGKDELIYFGTTKGRDRAFDNMQAGFGATSIKPGDIIRVTSEELHDIAYTLTQLFEKGEVGEAARNALITFATSPGSDWLITDEIRNLVSKQKEWDDLTVEDLEVLKRQRDVLDAVSEATPNWQRTAAADIKELADSLPPAKFGALKIDSWFETHILNGGFGMANGRTILRHLGAFGEKLIADYNKATDRRHDMTRQINKLFLHPADKLFTSEEREAMRFKITFQGIETTREEMLGRFLQIGTIEGQKRVLGDYFVKVGRSGDSTIDAAAGREFLAAISTFDIKPKELAWLKSRWDAHEKIWFFAKGEASVVEGLNTKPKTPQKVLLTVNGESVSVVGGYATIGYIGMVPAQVEVKVGSDFNPIGHSNELFMEVTKEVKDRPLNLTMSFQDRAMERHIQKVAFMDVAKRVSMLVNDNDVTNRLETIAGSDYTKRLVAHANHAINGTPVTSSTEVGLSYFHANAVFATYALNPTSWAKQLLGFVGAIGHPSIGVSQMTSTVSKLLGQPSAYSEAIAFAKMASSMMRHRIATTDADETVIDSTVSGKPSVGERFRRGTTWMTGGLRWAQFLGGDIPTWTAAYDKHVKKMIVEGRFEKELPFQPEARDVADKVLSETQGSAYNAEQAVVNRNVYGKAFTFALKWSINNANYIYRTAKTDPKTALKYAFFSTFVSSLLMQGMGAALQVMKPEDEERLKEEGRDNIVDAGGSLALQALEDSLTSGHYLLPRIADVIKVGIIQQRGGMSAAGESLGPISRNLARGIDPIKEIRDATDDSEKTQGEIGKAIAGAISSGSILIPGIPATELRRIVKTFETDHESGWDHLVAAIFGEQYVAP